MVFPQIPHITFFNAALFGGILFPIAVGLGSSFTHCAGMCGPIHLFLAAKAPGGGGPWAYHAGRILGYGILGVTVGLLGSAMGMVSAKAFRDGAGIALILVYAAFGLGLLGWVPAKFTAEKLLAKAFPSRAFGKLSADGVTRPVLFSAGLMASLLPCPSTHAVLLWGMGLANPVASGAGMLALGISTLPVFGVLSRGNRALTGGSPGMARGSLSFPGRVRAGYRHGLGAVFLGISAWRLFALFAVGSAACH